MATASATATEPSVKAYRRLIDYLIEKDAPVFFADLPRELQELKILGPAWSEGMIEFGRRHYIETGIPFHESSRREKTIVLLENGISWTGLRSNKHKPLRELLAEEAELPAEVYEQKKILKVPRTESEVFEIVRTKVDRKLLGLQIRITDKGYAALAV